MYDFERQSDCTCVMCDVTTLYTGIPHNRGNAGLSHYLGRYAMELRKYMLMVTLFPLSHNFFSSLMASFFSRRGCLLAACFSPTLANLYVAWWRESC